MGKALDRLKKSVSMKRRSVVSVELPDGSPSLSFI